MTEWNPLKTDLAFWVSASCKQRKLGTKVKVDLTLGTNFMNTDIVITASFDYYE